MSNAGEGEGRRTSLNEKQAAETSPPHVAHELGERFESNATHAHRTPGEALRSQ